MSYKNKGNYESVYDKWARLSILNHKRKGFDVQILQEELVSMAENSKQCKLCGCNLMWGGGKISDLTPTLDRIKNEKIIKIDNSQIICWRCNRVKGNMSMDEFIRYCEIVYKIARGEKVSSYIIESMAQDRIKITKLVSEARKINKMLAERIYHPRSMEELIKDGVVS